MYMGWMAIFRSYILSSVLISTHNPAFCQDVYVTHTSGVLKQSPMSSTRLLSPPEQIYAYMENPQPSIRAVELLYMYEMLP